MRAMVAEVEMKEEEESGRWVELASLQALPSGETLVYSNPRCFFWVWRPSTAETGTSSNPWPHALPLLWCRAHSPDLLRSCGVGDRDA